MPAYFDSSVLLSLLMGDQHAERSRSLWHEEHERVSSTLLHVECATVLRRIPTVQLSLAARREATQQLAYALEEVTLKPLDRDIAAIASVTEALGECRTLDVAHVATAMFFRQGGDSELRLCTFDLRMAEVAARVGFVVATHQG